jgi:hypothetical protein
VQLRGADEESMMRGISGLGRWLGLAGLTAVLVGGAVPVQAAPLTPEIINPDGGTNQDDGIKIIVMDGKHQIIRNGEYQVYDYNDTDPYVDWIVTVGDNAFAGCYASGYCPDGSVNWNPGSVEMLPQPDADTWVTVQQFDGALGDSGFITMTVTMTYTTPNPYIDVEAGLTWDEVTLPSPLPPGATPRADTPFQLYFGTDLSLDGLDDGPGFLEEDADGLRTFGQYSDTPAPGAFSGIREVADSPMTSIFLGYYTCAFEKDAVDPEYPGCTADGPGGTNPAYGAPVTEYTDAGAGAHWELPFVEGTQTVRFQLVYSSWDAFNGPAEVPPAVQCDQLPDMAVSPQFIELTAGGTAQIEVALRNLCPDKPFNYSDVLLSLSDGIVVTDVPAGWLNLTQRAAWQNLSLAPDETKRALITVSAPNGVPAGPTHITELYYMGGVAKRIDGVFISPAAAPAVVEAPAVVVEPAVPAAPAPLPAALPNTGGPLLPLGLLAAAGAALLAAGAARRRM